MLEELRITDTDGGPAPTLRRFLPGAGDRPLGGAVLMRPAAGILAISLVFAARLKIAFTPIAGLHPLSTPHHRQKTSASALLAALASMFLCLGCATSKPVSLRPKLSSGSSYTPLSTIGVTGNQFAHAIDQRFSGQMPTSVAPINVTFATLPAELDGQSVYCQDCQATNPCSGSGSGTLATGIAGQWACIPPNAAAMATSQPPAIFATVTNFSGTVSCPANTTTKLFNFSPGWSYVPGYSHMGTWVHGHVLLCNATASDSTGVQVCLGTGNCGPGFTVKANSCFDRVAEAGDGFTSPTTFWDYSPMVFVPSGSSALTAYGENPLTDIVEFFHPF